MPEYLSPGVYMEEVEVGSKPIEGVSTSTAGFLGATERGPLKPRLITNFTDYQRVYGGYINDSFLTYSVDAFFTNGGKRVYVGRVVSTTNKVAQTHKIKDSNGKPSFILRATGPGSWANRISIKIDKASLSDKNSEWFKLTLHYYSTEEAKNESMKDNSKVKPDSDEIFDNISTNPKSSTYFKKVINGTSNLVTVWASKGYTPGALPNTTSKEFMGTSSEPSPVSKDKKDKEEPPKAADSGIIDLSSFKGWEETIKDPFDDSVVEVIQTGLLGFTKIDEISIVCAPDEVNVEGLQGAVTTHCENMKDRFAVLQSKRDNNVPAKFDQIANTLDSKYAAIYMPWVNMIDPPTGLKKLVPPGGHIAGIYARSDIERGVHKAPANETVRGINGLQIVIDKGQQSTLNPKGVNVLRSFPGRGVLVWGARTTSSDPNWKYINVRRLFIYIEKSIERATQWLVFEPNNEKLWARVVATINQFLNGVWRTGALMGTTQNEAFFVKCDRSTMTQDDIDNGRLVCLIGIAPTKPAEFVIFRIAQTKSGTEIEEL